MTNPKLTKLCSMLLAISMILALFSGCGRDAGSGDASAGPTDASVQEEAPAENEAAAVSAPDTTGEASAPELDAGEPVAAESDDQFRNISFSEQVELAAEGNFIEKLMDFPYPEETALPVTEEDVTFTYFMRTQPFMMAYGGEVDYDSLSFFKEWQARTGITLDMTVVTLVECAEKFQLMVASGDYANFMECIENFTGGPTAALEQEVIYGLDDLVDEYMPNYAAWLDSDDNYRRVCTSVDGQLYLMGYLEYGSLSMMQGGIINQDWLDEAGLDVPVTYDDMYETLTAFKSNGHPGALWMTSGVDTIAHVYNSGYEVANHMSAARGSGFINKDGTVVCTYLEDNMRDYLTMMNKWYSEGLIYPDFTSIDPSNDTIDSGLVTSGTIGVYSGAFNTAETLMRDSGITLSPMGNLRQTPDQTIHLCVQSIYQKCGLAFGTSIDEKLLPIAAQAVDYLFSKEGIILSNFGVEGEGLVYDENGMPQCSDLILNNPDLAMSAIGIVLYSKFGGAGINFVPREYSGYDEAYWNACRVWADNLDNAYEMPYEDIFTVNESEKYDNIMSDINTYVSENTLKFVIGDRSLTEWDDFVSTLKAMGIEDAVAIYQGALDRHLA